jgi:hypothetical protein
MAHELKNSLTHPHHGRDAGARRRNPAFTAQAAEIVIDEVESLERRVRPHRAEPPMHPSRWT